VIILKSEEGKSEKDVEFEQTRLRKESIYLFAGGIFMILVGIFAGIRIYQEWRPENDLSGAIIMIFCILLLSLPFFYGGFRFRRKAEKLL
jgi:hypothetical protein